MDLEAVRPQPLDCLPERAPSSSACAVADIE